MFVHKPRRFRLPAMVSAINNCAVHLSVKFVGRGPALLLGLIWIVAGCHSQPSVSSSRLASVVITNKPIAEVEAMTRTVFTEHGYQAARGKSSQLVFEKEGTGMNTLVYGDWSSKKVWVRVKVYFQELNSAEQVLLECDAFMVGDHGDIHFEEEHKLTRVHRGRFQDLLNEVSQQLKFTGLDQFQKK